MPAADVRECARLHQLVARGGTVQARVTAALPLVVFAARANKLNDHVTFPAAFLALLLLSGACLRHSPSGDRR
jgi:hypothetical protein